MSDIESVIFSYDNRNRLEYQLYADCLRLMGIYVCEDIVDSINGYAYEKRWKDADFSIRYQIVAPSDCSHAAVELGKREWLKKKLSRLKEDFVELADDEDFFSCFDEISNIFVKYGLLQAGTVLQYFQMNAKQVLDAGRKFEQAADALTDLQEERVEWKNNRYMNYAGLYCRQKTNLSCLACKKPVVYYVDKLAMRALRLAVDYPDFSNAWVLLGMICERKKQFVRETVDAYQRAVDAIGNKPYASSIYYWMGKCFQGESDVINAYAKSQYRKAYDCMKKYRNIYKMAVSCLNGLDYRGANGYFLECIQHLERKGDFLNPLEQEYYFKVTVQISYCYLKQMDYCNSLDYAEKALRFRKKIKIGSPAAEFYRKLYGNDEEDYIKLAINEMKDKQAVQYKMIAERELRITEAKEN